MIDIKKTLSDLKIKDVNNGSSTGSVSYGQGEIINSYSPVDGKLIGGVTTTTKEEYEKIMLVQQMRLKIGGLYRHQNEERLFVSIEKLRFYKQSLGELVSYEMGKSLQEGLGEVQEMIDIWILRWTFKTALRFNYTLSVLDIGCMSSTIL